MSRLLFNTSTIKNALRTRKNSRAPQILFQEGINLDPAQQLSVNVLTGASKLKDPARAPGNLCNYVQIVSLMCTLMDISVQIKGI